MRLEMLKNPNKFNVGDRLILDPEKIGSRYKELTKLAGAGPVYTVSEVLGINQAVAEHRTIDINIGEIRVEGSANALPETIFVKIEP